MAVVRGDIPGWLQPDKVGSIPTTANNKHDGGWWGVVRKTSSTGPHQSFPAVMIKKRRSK